MKIKNFNGYWGSYGFRWTVLVVFIGLAQVSALSQSSTSSSSRASLRGTAKLDGTLVIDGVIVALVPVRKPGVSVQATGKPQPALVKRGKYRIDEISPGTYDVIAEGKARGKRPGVAIQPGSSNIVDIILSRSKSRTKMHAKVMNSQGTPLPNTTVAIYSSELPPSICEKCKLAEVTSNEFGEVEHPDLASGQLYSLAVAVPSGASGTEAKMLAADAIAIGGEGEARIELRLGEGPQPVLNAKLLNDLPSDLNRQMPSPEIANVNDPRDSRTVASGQKIKIKGVVTRRDADTFTVRDLNGVDTVVRLDDRTSVKAKGGFLQGGSNYAQTNILRGLNLQVEGRGNTSGELVADKVRFNESDLKVARAVESRAAPLEERATTTENKLTQVEKNEQRLSGQLDELAAVANTARGGAKTAQEIAEAAVAGVNATNERISALDDYEPQDTMAVNFRTGSAVLSADAKARLDEIATKTMDVKGYVLEISGYADATGSIARNRALSQQRANAVIRYLVENHNIPLRRIITPYGYGELSPVAENNTREGRAQNRRVEVKLLVNKGLVEPTPTMKTKS